MKESVPEIPYIRIGTTYYKIFEAPLPSGNDTKLVREKWKKEIISHDEGKEYLALIPKYNAFTLVPDHVNYKREIMNCYNEYEPISHIPAPGPIDNTEMFLKHIFGEQYELALDYLALLYLKPLQILPILCLVSKERNTGKTTFLNWLKAIFELNATLNKNEDFRSQFNSDWTTKLLICIDETLLDKKEDSERLKNLSTSRFYKTEAKGVDKQETHFFGKFILCSNNEDSFIYIEPEEQRYWVRKVPVLPHDDVNLLDKLKAEIPAFLYSLNERGVKSEPKSRMWFLEKDIWTPALQKLKEANRTSVEKEIIQIIKDHLLDFDLPAIHFTNQDLIYLLKEAGIKINRHFLSKILQERWKYYPVETPRSYLKYSFQYEGENINTIKKKGRYYTFKRNNFIESSQNSNEK